MEMMLASLNNLLKSTGNVKVERVEDLILQEKALTEAILLKQGTLASIRRSGESSGERSLPGSPKGTVDHHPLSDEEDSSFTAGPQRPAFTTLTADDDLLPLCPSQPFMPSLSTPEDEPSISSHIIPVHAYVSAPDVQPTYQEILAEIKGRKKSGSRPPMDPTRRTNNYSILWPNCNSFVICRRCRSSKNETTAEQN
ncbi:hypothetical protein RvY_12570-3 [Ramazzottius varieornatus]|uniref:Uncharacterized protein n=1 Tax=Ramazzottius varieornatus TaxID=947166 RepID=A0A1D1VQE4_RAMVA|nr:hypothetical protein RvY_12570-3 [Ramazzottius varieornatus]